MKNIKILRTLLISCLLLLLFPAVVFADSIQYFDSDISVTKDNTVQIVEHITYDPENVPHHGIFRFVPAQFSDAAGHKYYTTITLQSVTDKNGVPYKIAESHNNSKELYLKIGDPNTTFIDPHVYVITYTIKPLVLRSGDHDRLILNITGQEWNRAITSVVATFSLPAESTAACYTGITGSTDSDCSVYVDGKTINVQTQKPLPAYRGLTVDIQLPANSFSTYLQPDVRPPLKTSEKLTIGLVVVASLLLLTGIVIELYQKITGWRARRNQTIIAQYEPPNDLKPAEIGMLAQRKKSVENITATIIDLAARGYIQIELIRPKRFWRSADYSFTKLKAFGNLTNFEQTLVSKMFQVPKKSFSIFRAGDPTEVNTIKLSSLKNNVAMPLAVENFNKQIAESLKNKNYFFMSPNIKWGYVLINSWIASVVLSGIALGHDPRIAWLGLAAFAMALLSLILAIKRTGLTKAGTTEWGEIEGFKLFLSVTQKDRLKFFNDPKNLPPKLTAKLFSDFLPYAIALKVEKQWTKQFAGIDVSRTVGAWYISPGGTNFSAADFGTSFSGAFNSAVSGSFAGSSGGGGAGGGGGGGGGGGW